MASSFLNCPGVRCGTGWSSAWPERVIGVARPLADLAALGRDQLRPADLAGSTLMFPAAGGRLDFLTRFAGEFEINRTRIRTLDGDKSVPADPLSPLVVRYCSGLVTRRLRNLRPPAGARGPGHWRPPLRARAQPA